MTMLLQWRGDVMMANGYGELLVAVLVVQRGCAGARAVTSGWLRDIFMSVC